MKKMKTLKLSLLLVVAFAFVSYLSLNSNTKNNYLASNETVTVLSEADSFASDPLSQHDVCIEWVDDITPARKLATRQYYQTLGVLVTWSNCSGGFESWTIMAARKPVPVLESNGEFKDVLYQANCCL